MVLFNHSVITENENAMPPIPKPATGYDPAIVLSISHAHTLSPLVIVCKLVQRYARIYTVKPMSDMFRCRPPPPSSGKTTPLTKKHRC